MTWRLLIDECLSPDLVELAIDAGHVESTCLRDRGLLGTQDWTLIKHVLDADFTLVTVNAQDFRGRGQNAPGGLYAHIELHAGLICLNSARSMDLRAQRVLFEAGVGEHMSSIKEFVDRILSSAKATDGNLR